MLRQRLHEVQDLRHDGLDLDRLQAQLHLSRLDLGQVEYVVDQAEKMLAARMDLRKKSLLRGAVVLTFRCVDEQLREADDRVERSAQLVAHVGEEHALVLTRLLELPVRVLELGDQALALEPGGHRAHELLNPVELVAPERRRKRTRHDHEPAVPSGVDDRQRDQRASAAVEAVAADAFRQL